MVDARPCNVFVVLRRVRNSRTIIIVIIIINNGGIRNVSVPIRR